MHSAWGKINVYEYGYKNNAAHFYLIFCIKSGKYLA